MIRNCIYRISSRHMEVKDMTYYLIWVTIISHLCWIHKIISLDVYPLSVTAFFHTYTEHYNNNPILY